MFYLDVACVCNVFLGVSDACFKCFICLFCMLQVLHLNVLKVNRVLHMRCAWEAGGGAGGVGSRVGVGDVGVVERRPGDAGLRVDA